MAANSGDPPLASPRRRPSPNTAADAVPGDTHRRPPPSDAPDEPSSKECLLSSPPTISDGRGLRFLLTPNDSDGSLESEELGVLSNLAAKMSIPQHLLTSTTFPGVTSVMFLPDREVTSEPRVFSNFSPDLAAAAATLPPGLTRRVIEFILRRMPILQPAPPVCPPTPPVTLPLFSCIQMAYKGMSDSLRSFGSNVKELSQSCIKNPQSVKLLEKRLEKVEEKVEENLKLAKSALEIAKESKKIQEETYTLLKQKLNQHSSDARQSYIERLKTLIEKPKPLVSIIGTLIGYINVLKDLNDLIHDIYGRIPDEAAEVPKELQVMIDEVECLEIKDSRFDLIGSFSSDLFNEHYSSNVFSLVAQVPAFSVSSMIKRAKDKNLNEGKRNQIIMESVFGDLELNLATDMESSCLASFSGDVHEGVRETLSFSIPDKNAQVELIYQNVYGGCRGLVASRPTKMLSFSGIFGLKAFSVGVDVAFDASSNTLSKFDCAAGFDNTEYSASIAIAKKCDQLRGTIARKLWPGTSVGAEVSYDISNGKKTAWVGASHQYDDSLLLKAKVSGDCKAAAAAVQYKWTKKCAVSLSCQVEYKDQSIQPGFGIGFAFRP